MNTSQKKKISQSMRKAWRKAKRQIANGERKSWFGSKRKRR